MSISLLDSSYKMLEKLLRYALANWRKPLHLDYGWYAVIVEKGEYILKYRSGGVKWGVAFNIRQLVSLEVEFVTWLVYNELFKYDDNKFYKTECDYYNQRDIEYWIIEFALTDEEEIVDIFKDNIKWSLIDKK